MDSFKTFDEQWSTAELLAETFNAPQPQVAKPPVWSAKKPEIMQMWRNMRPDAPIIVTPIDKSQPGEHHSYGEDGIRITGSWGFVSAVLGRIKELLAYENPQTKMRLILRGVDKTRLADPNKNSFVFYFNLERRTHGKPGRPSDNRPGVL